jgi:hypothetical protein
MSPAAPVNSTTRRSILPWLLPIVIATLPVVQPPPLTRPTRAPRARAAGEQLSVPEELAGR